MLTLILLNLQRLVLILKNQVIYLNLKVNLKNLNQLLKNN